MCDALNTHLKLLLKLESSTRELIKHYGPIDEHEERTWREVIKDLDALAPYSQGQEMETRVEHPLRVHEEKTLRDAVYSTDTGRPTVTHTSKRRSPTKGYNGDTHDHR